MPKIKLLQSFAGKVGSVDSPNAGMELDVSADLAKALCDGERAVSKGASGARSAKPRARKQKATRTPRGEKRG